MFKLVFSFLFSFVILCISLPLQADTWRGTAPFCSGECKEGETAIRRDKSGDGAYCWTGTKVLCRNDEPQCNARQTKTRCYGVVMICDDGYYEWPGEQWKSCNKYACGACFGFDF